MQYNISHHIGKLSTTSSEDVGFILDSGFCWIRLGYEAKHTEKPNLSDLTQLFLHILRRIVTYPP